MDIREHIINNTESMITNLLRSVRAMPDDKVNWAVMDQGRSPLQQLQECAQSPQFFISLIKNRTFPEMTEESMAVFEKERAAWNTIDACEAKMKENCAQLYECVRGLSDDDLNARVNLPWDEGKGTPLSDIAGYQYWNLVYHLGQVNFIQTLYGDKEMH